MRPSRAMRLGFVAVMLMAGCASSSPGSTCSQDTDCEGGELCVGGVCRRFCNSATECAPAESCTDGVCQPVTNPECSANEECVTPSPCEVQNGVQCVAGECIYSTVLPGAGCDDGNPCTSGDTCDEDNECIGIPRVCNTAPGSECIATDTVFRTYSNPGTCDPATGDCVYPPNDTPCDRCTVQCLSCTTNGDCGAGLFCGASGSCTPTLGDGGDCSAFGSGACTSGYCDGSLCCSGGDCCNNAVDCPLTYESPSTCNDVSPNTDCQGSRMVRACQSNVCASSAVDNDSGCSSVVRSCPNNFADIACSDEADQAAPTCATSCGGNNDCATGFFCVDQSCIPPVGSGSPCTGMGQGSCESGLECENGVCCEAGSATCCDSDTDCDDGLQCNISTFTCYETCNNYDDSRCADSNDFCFANACTPKLGDGQSCANAGECLSAYCNNSFCCDTGTCCSTESDCPGTFSRSPTCFDTGPTTDCQGDREDATCTSSRCGSNQIEDDSGCLGSSLACPNNLASIACTAAVSQSAPMCPSGCGGDEDCALGFICSNTMCVSPVVDVLPIYPMNADWNDYVRFDEPSSGIYRQDDVGCDGSEVGGPSSCVHGGELRAVEVPGFMSCANLTLAETLSAFTWTCDDNGGAGPVEFLTAGLAPGVGLADLLSDSGTGWEANSVTITDEGSGMVVAFSDPLVWGWTNPVLLAPYNGDNADDVLALTDPETIYTIAADQQTWGYNLNADKQALVVLDGATLFDNTNANGNCLLASGEMSAASGDECMVAAGSQDFLWLEGRFGDTSNNVRHTLYLVNVRHSRLHQVRVSGGSQGGARMMDVTHSLFTDSDFFRNASSGLTLHTLDEDTAGGSDYNVLRNLRFFRNVESSSGGGLSLVWSNFNHVSHLQARNSEEEAISLFGSQYNVFTDVIITNTDQDTSSQRGAIDINRGTNASGNINSQGNIFTNIFVAGSDHHGLWGRNNMNYTTMSHYTAFTNGEDGLNPNESIGFTATQTLLVANGSQGYRMFSPSGDVQFAEVFSAHNDSYGVQLFNNDNTRTMDTFEFFGNLWTGNNGNNACAVFNDADMDNVGLDNVTCSCDGTEGSNLPSPSECGSGDPAYAVYHPDQNLSASFSGKITADDSVSPHDTNGTAAYDTLNGSLEDWFATETPYRFWAADGPAFPGQTRGPCSSGQMCRLWDLRVNQSDTVVRNVLGAFTGTAACPTSAAGTRAITDNVRWAQTSAQNMVEDLGAAIGDGDGVCDPGEQCVNHFLVNALERIDDGIGDDDGLCETDEACIYSPNVGAYQGEGALSGPCIFQETAGCNSAPCNNASCAGELCRITLYGYATNGL